MALSTSRRVVRFGVLQAILIATLIYPYSIRAQDNPGKARQTNSSDPYVVLLENQVALHKQNELLRNEVGELKLMIKGMVELQGRLSLPTDERKKIHEIEVERAKEAAKQLEAKTDFASKAGEDFRNELKKIAGEITSTKIDGTTSKAVVTEFIGKIEGAQDFIKREKRKAERNFEASLRQIENTPIGKLVRYGRIQENDLKKISDDKLLKAVQKLDPSIKPEELARLRNNASALYSKIMVYSNAGKFTPELVAALGDDLAAITGDKLSDGAKKFIEDAKTVVDVTRAGADFASFAISTMQAAISTGNPYVIAAAAVLILLIALFKALFSGGGGGGDGEGGGKGDKKGKGEDKKQGQGKDEGTVPGQDDDVNRNRGTGGIPAGQDPNQNQQQPSQTVPGVKGNEIPGLDPNGPFRAVLKAESLVIEERANSKIVAEVPVNNVTFNDPNNAGASTRFNFQPTSVSQVNSFELDTKVIKFKYKGKDNKEADASLRPDSEKKGSWIISGSIIQP